VIVIHSYIADANLAHRWNASDARSVAKKLRQRGDARHIRKAPLL